MCRGVPPHGARHESRPRCLTFWLFRAPAPGKPLGCPPARRPALNAGSQARVLSQTVAILQEEDDFIACPPLQPPGGCRTLSSTSRDCFGARAVLASARMTATTARVLAALLVVVVLGICAPERGSAEAELPSGIVSDHPLPWGCSSVINDDPGLPQPKTLLAAVSPERIEIAGPGLTRSADVHRLALPNGRPVFLDFLAPRAPPLA